MNKATTRARKNLRLMSPRKPSGPTRSLLSNANKYSKRWHWPVERFLLPKQYAGLTERGRSAVLRLMANYSQIENRVRLDLAIEVLREFGELRFVARGASMLPSIRPGDMLVVRQARVDEIRMGDVVLYVRNECFYAHRAICLDSQLRLTTRGDALAQADPLIDESELLGLVTAVIRGLKTIRLTQEQGARARFLRWALHRSDFATQCLLRSYRLVARCTAKLNNERGSMSEKLLGIS